MQVCANIMSKFSTISSYFFVYHVSLYNSLIRDIPDHATFREKVQTLHWLDKLEGFLSLTYTSFHVSYFEIISF